MTTRTCCASVIGRAHRLAGRACQDAGVAFVRGPIAVAVVSDGCSSGRHSELGAGVGARAVAAAAARRAAAGAAFAELPALVLSAWTAELAQLAMTFAVDDSLAETVNEALLATLLVAVVRHDEAVVFGVGDGVFAIDGRVTALDQGEAPDYPAYGLFPWMRPPRLVVHHAGPFATLMLATDGAIGFDATLLPLAREPRVFSNPSLLQKRLNVLRDGPRPPEDDCTVAFVTREVPPCV